MLTRAWTISRLGLALGLLVSCGAGRGIELDGPVFDIEGVEVRGIQAALGPENVEVATFGLSQERDSSPNGVTVRGTLDQLVWTEVSHWRESEPFELGPDSPGTKFFGYRGEDLGRVTVELCGVDFQFAYFRDDVSAGLVWALNLDSTHPLPRLSGSANSGLGWQPNLFAEMTAAILIGLYVEDEPVFRCSYPDVLEALNAHIPDFDDVYPEPEIDPNDYGVPIDVVVPGIELVDREDLFRVEVFADGTRWRQSEWYEIEVLEYEGDEFVFDGDFLAGRLYGVTDAGRELLERPSLEDEDAVFTTPFSVFRGRDGNFFSFALDTKGEMPDVMRDALIAVIAQEFRNAGATSIRVSDVL